MHPKIAITVDGAPVSEGFLSRLLQVTVTDKEGTSADTIDLELDAGTPFLALPRKKAIITCAMGYEETGVSSFGSFTADDITLECLPYKIKIQGKSADMREKLKEHKTRHWDGQTFGGIVNEIAGENGLSAQVDPEIGAYAGQEGYFLQQGESSLHWIERQSRKLNGLFAIKDGKLIVAKKGSGMTAGGA